jgi:glucose-6-phosphate 1-dehydrogenase
MAGVVEGHEVPGYLDEEQVASESTVETFVAARAWIDNPRWNNVPFFLRTGKRLPQRMTEILLVLRDSERRLFEDAGIARLPAHHLALRIQPDEGISVVFRAKEPGPGMALDAVRMNFSYGDSFRTRPTEAYERLLHDAMAGDQTLFLREDGVERSWEIVAPVLDTAGTVHPYAAGTWGPSAADELIAPHAWGALAGRSATKG